MKTLTPEQQQQLEAMRPVLDQYMLELAAMQEAALVERQRQEFERRTAEFQQWQQEDKRQQALLANWLAAKEQGLLKRATYPNTPAGQAQHDIDSDAENAHYFPGMHSLDIWKLKNRHSRLEIEEARKAIEAQEQAQ